MTSRKKVGFIAGAGMGAAAAAALRRRWSKTAEVPEPGVAATTEADSAGDLFVDHLAAAVQIPTVSLESGGEPESFVRFREYLEATYPRVHEHLERELVGEHTLLFTWEGSDGGTKPFLLMAHQDVVPVEPGTEDDWEHGPFSGDRTEEHLWGRGTLDDKIALVGVLDAVEGLLAEGFSPGATIYLAFGHDEETGGANGAALVAELLGERGVRLGFVLDEGGAVVSDMIPGVPAPLALVGIGEKSSVDVEISASAPGGHSSLPPKQTAIGKVAAAITALERKPMPARLSAQRALFDALATTMRGPKRALLKNLDWTGKVAERALAGSDTTNALIRTTAAVTVIRGGVRSNLLPQEAVATVNFRILPGDTVASVLNHVRSVVGDDVRVATVRSGSDSDPTPVSSTDTPGFAAISGVIGDVFPDAVVAPWILTAMTDSRYFAPLADGLYRFAPMRLAGADRDRVHGSGERLALADAPLVVRFYRSLITRAGGAA